LFNHSEKGIKVSPNNRGCERSVSENGLGLTISNLGWGYELTVTQT